MSAEFEDLKLRALRLSPPERDELIRALIGSIDGEPEDTPEAIAQAWGKEIARRIADLEHGKSIGIPTEQVLAEIRAMIAGHGKR
ncbi:MAG: addiction module protein [Burkholderiales bacterium]